MTVSSNLIIHDNAPASLLKVNSYNRYPPPFFATHLILFFFFFGFFFQAKADGAIVPFHLLRVATSQENNSKLRELISFSFSLLFCFVDQKYKGTWIVLGIVSLITDDLSEQTSASNLVGES